MNIIDIDKVKDIAIRLGLVPSSKACGRCIIIGGSPSLKGTSLGKYVDAFKGDVIRVNAPANPQYVNDCGSRTDILFRSNWLDKHVYDDNPAGKIVIGEEDTMCISSDFGLKDGLFLTTGTLCVILAVSVYDSVELLGFGEDGTSGTNMFVTLHPVPHRDGEKKGARCPHDIDFEHDLLRKMESGQFSGRIIQLESSRKVNISPVSKPNWDRFDRKVLVTFTGNKYTRVANMMSEMSRVGMDGVEILWQFPSPITPLLMDRLRHDKYIHHGGYFNCTMGHYRAIATAYHLGCSEALFMEDDIRFLKNTDEISRAIESMPDDYDIVTFDPSYRSWPKDDFTSFSNWRRNRKVNEYWSEFDRMFSMGCYALSRRGMEKLMACFESVATDRAKGMIRVCDHYLDRALLGNDTRMYFTRKNVCMQVRMGSASSNMNTIEGRYIRMGLDFSEYQIEQNLMSKMLPNTREGVISSPSLAKIDPNNPIDAVFVIGRGSRHNNEELRYALRNLDAHCKFIRNVYIVGECPSWVDKSQVVHLKWPDRFSHAKDANIIDKLRHACEYPGISKNILFCSDDQFQTHECVWEDFYPRYLRQFEASDKYYEQKHSLWHTRLRKTLLRDVQRRKGQKLNTSQVYFYEPHIYSPIDRDKFIEYANWCDYQHRDDTITLSGYYNFVNEANGEPAKGQDHIFLSSRDKADIPSVTHVAYDDASYSVAMRILTAIFPNKSRFEVESNDYDKQSRSIKPIKPIAAVKAIKAIKAKPLDPWAPATLEELRKISEAMNKIKRLEVGDCPPGVLDRVVSMIPKAEEMRLYGVDGWRTVWLDIMQHVEGRADQNISDKADKIIQDYEKDPGSMRRSVKGEIWNRLRIRDRKW